MVTPNDILTAVRIIVASDEWDVTAFLVVADMVEDLGYSDRMVIDSLRNPDPFNLHWWALKKLMEHFGEKL